MDVDKLKQNAHVLIPACLAVLSSLYLLNKSKSNEKKGLKEIPYPSNSISWPLFGIYIYKKKRIKNIYSIKRSFALFGRCSIKTNGTVA
jgi:hypothetical protein